MKNELVFWLLFDDTSCSYKNTILNNQELFKSFQNIKVYGFGMNSFEQTKQIKNNIVYEYKQIDLSLTNKDLISTLAELPKPDIILASPPCESFSIADSICRMSQDYSNTNWIVLNRKWYQTRAKDLTIKNRVRDFVKKEKNRLNGESTAGATVHIIETFQPKYWVIENPRTSKLWDFQEQHWNFYGIKTPTYYYNYDLSFSQKPTIFKSNLELQLKKQILKTGYNKNHIKNGGYNQRSKIPEPLIVDILNQILNKFK